MSRWICTDDIGSMETRTDQELIDSAPSIEICFCRECKYYNGKYCFNSDVTLPTAPKADDFCSYGERRD